MSARCFAFGRVASPTSAPQQWTSWQTSCRKTISLEGFEVNYEKGVKMGLQLQIEEMPGYLAARFTGVGTPEEVWQKFELIAEHCKRTNNNKLLLDITGAYGDVSIADRYFVGKSGQIFAWYKIKVASVCRPEQMDPQKFEEMVARNLGVNVRAFTDAQSAEEWLLK